MRPPFEVVANFEWRKIIETLETVKGRSQEAWHFRVDP